MAAADDIRAARAAGWPISTDVERETLGRTLDDDIREANQRVAAAREAAGLATTGSPRDVEDRMQIAVIKWRNTNLDVYPEFEWLHHTPNGGKRQPGIAGKLKAMGAKPGILDLFLPLARGRYHGAYWELKAGKGQLRKEQRQYIEHLTREGYYTKVVYDDWRDVVEDMVAYIRRRPIMLDEAKPWRQPPQWRRDDAY